MIHSEDMATSQYLNFGIDEKHDCICPDNFRNKSETDTAVIWVIVAAGEMYLDEWIDYHLGSGFIYIFIYDNSVDFDLDQSWLECCPHLCRKVTVQHYPGSGKQLPAYQHCVKNHLIPQHHGWAAFFDADEFLFLKKHTDITHFYKSISCMDWCW